MNPGPIGDRQELSPIFHFLRKWYSTFTKTSLQSYFSSSLSARQKYLFNVNYFLCNSLLLLLHVHSTNVELCMYITAVIVMVTENTKHIPFNLLQENFTGFLPKKLYNVMIPPNLPPSHLSVHFELQYGIRCLFVLILWLDD